MSCPWRDLTEPGQLDKVCEANLCAWVVEPGNTASNLAYLLVGLWLLSRPRNGSRAHWFGYLAIVIAVGSSAYHATNLSWGRMADWASIYGITGVMTALNLRRWLEIGTATQMGTALGLPALMIGIVSLRPDWALPVLLIAMPCCYIECWLAHKHRAQIEWRHYLLAWSSGGAAVIAWALDDVPHLCDPSRHWLSGHAIWHLLSAGFLLQIELFYRQFDSFADVTK
nr:ceramidase domain-containing protein [Oceanococcus sp. HetDA_MAG_MS8]